MSIMTVKELKEKLNEYPDDFAVVVMRDANGHYYPITNENWCEVIDPYFGTSDEVASAVRISVI